MTTVTVTPDATESNTAATTATPPAACPDCGGPTRVTYVAAGDRMAPGLWSCTACPAGQRAWPASRGYPCG